MASNDLESSAPTGARSASWEAVERIKARELANLDDKSALRIIESLRMFAPSLPDPLNGMGLVEQQRLFHRGRG